MMSAPSLTSPVGKRRGSLAAGQWEDEGVRWCRINALHRNPSPSHAARGALPLPLGEVFC